MIDIILDAVYFLIDILTVGASVVTAICTGIMAIAIIAGAVIAVITIKSTKSIEENKVNIRRKSLAKNLLFEVMDNNFELDRINDSLIINDILEASKEELEKEDYKYKYIFADVKMVIYNIFLKSSIDIDFKQEDIAPLLREYYKELDYLIRDTRNYNDIKMDDLDFKKWYYSHLIIRVRTIKITKKIDTKILVKLQKEADFNLEEKGLLRKYEPFDG